MLRRALLFSLLLSAAPLAAQQEPFKFEVFAGEGFHADHSSFASETANSWSLSVTRNLNAHLGLTTDLGAEYRSKKLSPCTLLYIPGSSLPPTDCTLGQKTRFGHLLLGPSFHRRYGPLTVSAQHLFGRASLQPAHDSSTSSLVVGAASVFQAVAYDTFAFRVLRLDSSRADPFGNRGQDLRVQGGVILRFGRF